jgi:hypothetical protein
LNGLNGFYQYIYSYAKTKHAQFLAFEYTLYCDLKYMYTVYLL